MQSTSKLQVAGQLALLPLQTLGLHEGTPALPAGKSTQVPRVTGALHTPQGPQALSQQTPCTQWPPPHCASALQPPLPPVSLTVKAALSAMTGPPSAK
jgi:hypothetical protein